jgi:hypothetical protein
MADRKVLATCLKALASTFRQEVTAEMAEAYEIGIGDLADDEVKRATRRALQECKFFPIPAELRGFAGKGGAKALKAEAAAAWERVQAALTSLGEYGGADFGPIANAVVRNMGGWAKMWNEPLKADPFNRRKFEELYEAFSDSAPTPERCQPLLPPDRGSTWTKGRFALCLPPGSQPTPRVLEGVEVSAEVRELAEMKRLT